MENDIMGSHMDELFSEIDKLRAELVHNVDIMADCQSVVEETSQ